MRLATVPDRRRRALDPGPIVAKNSIRVGELPDLITSVHASLTGLGTAAPVMEPDVTPAVPITRSITPLICLDDGKRFKMLRKHLAQLGMTLDKYRAKWGLPSDYPMVAPT